MYPMNNLNTIKKKTSKGETSAVFRAFPLPLSSGIPPGDPWEIDHVGY